MSALEKPNQNYQIEPEPAEVAGVFLETIPIFPLELVHSAVSRINNLVKQHGRIHQTVHPDYKNIDIYIN